MGLFKEAKNEQGFLKAGIMGFPGSGKSFTASKIAMGLVKTTGDKRPVFALDTEKGFDYLVSTFKDAGIELQIARTRAFADLLSGIAEAEKNASVLIIDSITHFWEEVQAAYKKKNNRSRISMADWGVIKDCWKPYTKAYLDSRLHIVMCGRAGDEYDSFENDEGKIEFHKSGTKMQAEKNLGYEPGLGIEMERVTVGKPKKGERSFVNRAYILKDRFDVLDGKFFDNPSYETFLPHIEKLNFGNHEPISSNSSEAMFDRTSDSSWIERKKQVEITLEEIQGEITSAIPGRSAEDTKAKTDLVQLIFSTRSWKAVEDMSLEDLRRGLTDVREWAKDRKQVEAVTAKGE